jgi:hypothetical protein
MPSAVVNPTPFAPGQSVGAYQDARETQSRGLKPIPAATETAVVAANGSLTYSSIAAGTYSLAAPTGGLSAQGLSYAIKSNQSVTVVLEDPGATSEPFAIAVSGRVITITLATDGDDALTSDLDAVIAGINGDPAAFALVTASLDGTVAGDTVAAAESLTFSSSNPGWTYMDLRVPAS